MEPAGRKTCQLRSLPSQAVHAQIYHRVGFPKSLAGGDRGCRRRAISEGLSGLLRQYGLFVSFQYGPVDLGLTIARNASARFGRNVDEPKVLLRLAQAAHPQEPSPLQHGVSGVRFG
jgi:hypothetical protein